MNLIVCQLHRRLRQPLLVVVALAARLLEHLPQAMLHRVRQVQANSQAAKPLLPIELTAKAAELVVTTGIAVYMWVVVPLMVVFLALVRLVRVRLAHLVRLAPNVTTPSMVISTLETGSRSFWFVCACCPLYVV